MFDGIRNMSYKHEECCEHEDDEDLGGDGVWFAGEPDGRVRAVVVAGRRGHQVRVDSQQQRQH